MAARAKSVEKSNVRGSIDRMLDRCFPEQLSLVRDPSRYISVLCPRRAGKTYAFVTRMLMRALLYPKAQILYVTLTGGQSYKNVMPILEDLDQEFELRGKMNHTKLVYRLPNGSKVFLAGAQTLAEVEKLRGQYYDLVIIDESKSFPDHIIKYLLSEVAIPLTADRLGSVVVGGTPGHVLGGYFYGITPLIGPELFGDVSPKDYQAYKPFWKTKRGSKGAWSFHHWGTKQNIRQPQIWQDFLDWKEMTGVSEADPGWKRERLGYWCQSDDLAVYRYTPEKSAYDGELPAGHDWKYIMGLDLGFHDDTAVVVAAWSETHDKMYHVYDKSIPHLTVDDIEQLIVDTKKRYPKIEAMVADTGGLGKTIAETLAQRGHPFHTADKREKYDHIELLNTDLLSGRVKVVRDSVLATQMTMLQWADETFKREDKRTPNHATDAFLYLWRYAYHHFWRPQKSKPMPGTDEWFEAWDNDCAAKAIEAHTNSTSRKLDQVPTHIKLDRF